MRMAKKTVRLFVKTFMSRTSRLMLGSNPSRS
jgi:hypothetical protein